MFRNNVDQFFYLTEIMPVSGLEPATFEHRPKRSKFHKFRTTQNQQNFVQDFRIHLILHVVDLEFKRDKFKHLDTPNATETIY